MEGTVLQSVAQFVILLFFTGPNRVSSLISPAPSGVKASVEFSVNRLAEHLLQKETKATKRLPRIRRDKLSGRMKEMRCLAG